MPLTPEDQDLVASEQDCAPDKIFQNIYYHGGSRIWRETKGGRELLADTYGNAEMAVAVKKCIENFLADSLPKGE